MSSRKSKSVLFMCFGNICRSPMAEALFRQMIKDSGQSANWEIDSAGIVDWNEGSQPFEHTMSVLVQNSIPVGDHRARKIQKDDFYHFDYILTMDEGVMQDLVQQKPKDSKANLELLRQYDPKQEVIKDPYGGPIHGYEKVFRQSQVCLKNFLESTTINKGM